MDDKIGKLIGLAHPELGAGVAPTISQPFKYQENAMPDHLLIHFTENTLLNTFFKDRDEYLLYPCLNHVGFVFKKWGKES